MEAFTHDAPTYGIIDKIVATAKVPYAALHDLDANKPGGSIKIRVKTYSHRLKRVEEDLTDALEGVLPRHNPENVHESHLPEGTDHVEDHAETPSHVHASGGGD